jgi:hypothetical protein
MNTKFNQKIKTKPIIIKEQEKIDKKIRKEKRSVSDMITCPLCGAMSYPIITYKDKLDGDLYSSDPNETSEFATMVCRSCHEDVLPYVEAYKEFSEVRAEQKKIEDLNKVSKAGIDYSIVKDMGSELDSAKKENM